MKRVEWTDATSYSRNKPRIQNAWQAQFGPVRIYITTAHIYYPDKWVVLVQPICSTPVELPSEVPADNLELAQVSALQFAGERLASYSQAYDAIMAEMVAE